MPIKEEYHNGELLGGKQEKYEDSPSVSREWWFSVPRNRKLLCYGTIILVALLILPSTYRRLKGLRAENFVNQSRRAFAVGDLQHGLSLLRQAEALSPGSPEVQYAVELYNARAGDINSLNSLLKQMHSGLLGIGDILGIAEIEANAGRGKDASEVIGWLPKNLGKQESLRLALIEATLLANKGELTQAAATCLAKSDSMEKGESGFLRIQGATYLLGLNEASAAQHASNILQSVAQEETAASISAWRIEVTRLLSSTTQNNDSERIEEIQKLLKLLPSLSKDHIQDQLLSYELEIQVDPARQDDLLKRLLTTYQNSDRSVALQIARWLNSRGYYSELIAFAGEEKPRNDTDWLLLVLDAKSALGKWDEIQAMLDSPASAGIPDAVRYLFLARIATMNGDKAAADDAWSSVTSSLRLEKPATLAYIAGYEEQIGAVDHAARTYREMANREETRRVGLTALIRIQPPSTPASTMIPLYEELTAEAPNYSDALGDLDYLKLLVKEDISQVSEEAEKLLEAQPTSLARISTAALGYLRVGDTSRAVGLYEGKSIDWLAAPLPWRVVRCAVLRASGDTLGADKLALSIDRHKLRPEEIKLLDKN